jgi:hypothetical protein
MNDKEFVLVSQGMEIMRTKSQENAINYVKKENDEWFDYKQRCIDNYEDYADNYIDLEIEYPEDKKYLQLKSNWNSLREWVQRHYDEYKDMEQDAMFEFGLVLDKMNELEGREDE